MSIKVIIMTLLMFIFGTVVFVAGIYLNDPQLSGLGGSLMGCAITAAFYEYEREHRKSLDSCPNQEYNI